MADDPADELAQGCYVTANDVRDTVAQDRTRPAGTAATLATAKLTDCARAASAEVDAALGTAGYRVPNPVPRLVHEVTVALAAQDADLTFREGSPQGDDHPILRRWEWAQRMLEVWAKGERLPLGLGPPASGEAGDVTVGAAVNTVPDLFGDELLATRDPFPPDEFYDPDWYRHQTR